MFREGLAAAGACVVLFAAAPAHATTAATSNLGAGGTLLVVTGDAEADTLVVRCENALTRVLDSDVQVPLPDGTPACNDLDLVQVRAGDGADRVVVEDGFAALGSTDLGGEGGADELQSDGPAPATMDGGSGADLLRNGVGADTLVGGADADVLRTTHLAGNVVLGVADLRENGLVTDTFSGIERAELTAAGAGEDTLDASAFAGALGVRLEGGIGADTLRGSAAADTLVGDVPEIAGNDVLDGNGGADLVLQEVFPKVSMTASGPSLTGHGSDVVEEVEDLHLLARSNGADRIDLSSWNGTAEASTGRGDDVLIGGPGREALHGEDGDDTIDSRQGPAVAAPATPDLADGGPGNDTLLDGVAGNASATATTLLQGAAVDAALQSIERLDLEGSADADTIALGAFPGTAVVRAGAGDDDVTGTNGADDLTGGSGADVLHGGDGADVLRARDGTADTLDCGPGADTFERDPIDVLDGSCEVPPPAPPAPPAAPGPVTPPSGAAGETPAAPAAGATPSAADPRTTLASRVTRARRGARGRLLVTVACAATATRTCAGTLTVAGGTTRRRLARRSYRVPRGKSVILTIRPSRVALSRVRTSKGLVALTMTLTGRDAAGRSATRRFRATVRL